MSPGEANMKAQGSGGATSAAWSNADLTANPHGVSDKQERVRRMFAAIAGSYDVNNRVHSFGLDQRWRRTAVKLAAVKPGDAVLDVACGTGDLSRLFADSGAARVTGLDYTEEMIEIARQKRGQSVGRVAKEIEYIRGDAQALPFADASFDVVSIAFGIRNVQDPAKAVREFFRVLRPGGRLVVLEFDRPRNGLIRFGNDLYTKRIMPLTATLISGDRSGAYRYLPKSVETFLNRDQLSGVLKTAGFRDVSQTELMFGVCVCHRGVK